MKLAITKKLFGLVGLFVLLTSVPAFAEEPTRHRWVGMQTDVGVPDGAALGVLVRPISNETYDWFRLGVSGTYNAMSPGVRFGATFDPIRFPVAPTLTLEGGRSFYGKVPGVSKSPDISYDYLNLHFGTEFGNRDVWRFFLRGGVSWIDIQTKNFQQTLDLKDVLTVSSPTFSGRIAPTFKLGFSYYF